MVNLIDDSSDSENENAVSGSSFVVEKDEGNSNDKVQIFRANLKSREDALAWLNAYKKETKTDYISSERKKSLQK